MKILFVTDERGGTTIPGGAVSYMYSVMRSAQKKHHEVSHLIAYDYINPSDVANRKDIILERLRNTIEEFDPDVINAYNICVWGTDVIEIANEIGVPIVLSMPDYMPFCKNRMLIKTGTSELCLSSIDCSGCADLRMGIPSHKHEKIKQLIRETPMIAISQFCKDVFVREGFPEDKIDVIQVGLNPDNYKPSRDYENTILNVSRMAFEKGLDHYNTIAGRLKGKHTFKLAGYPQVELNKHGVNFDYLGAITDNEKKYELRKCAIFVSTPRWFEPAGITYLEAKACGKPVIAFAMGGIPEYNPESNSIMVEYLNEDKVVEEIERLMSDEELRMRMGSDARKQIENVNNENILIEKTIEKFDRARGVR